MDSLQRKIMTLENSEPVKIRSLRRTGNSLYDKQFVVTEGTALLPCALWVGEWAGTGVHVSVRSSVTCCFVFPQRKLQAQHLQRAALLVFSVSLLPQGAWLSMRTSDRHAPLSADRSSFVAYIRDFSSCGLIYQRHHPPSGASGSWNPSVSNVGSALGSRSVLFRRV